MKINKTVLITGCSSGIGYCTALTFARQGYTVFASVRNLKSDGVKMLQEITEREGLDLKVLIIDVTNESTVKEGVELIKQKTGHIDILINNAGVMHLGPIESFSINEIRTQHETNFYGPIRLIKEIIPIMRAQKQGYIINVSSINGLVSAPLYGIYSSSKFALETTTEVLKFELAPFGIKVALVEPGVFNTVFWKNKQHPHDMKTKDSPYRKLVAFLDILENKKNVTQTSFMNNLLHPQRVADVIIKIARQNNPKLRYIVGYDAQLLLGLRKFLPEKLWFWLLSKTYRW